MTMRDLLRSLRPGLTVNDLRSTFSDWAAETTNFPPDLVEMTLAHMLLSQVEAAHR